MTSSLNMRSFSQEARELIEAAEGAGWTWRLSSNNHAIGRAPDGITTLSVSTKLSRSNRGYQRATAEFARWIREQSAPELAEQAMAVQEAYDSAPNGNPLLDDVMEASASRKIADMARSVRVIVSETTLMERSGDEAGVYESPTSTRREWSDDSVDYVCAYDGCAYNSPKHRAVASHYGRAHTGTNRPVVERVVTAPVVDAEAAMAALRAILDVHATLTEDRDRWKALAEASEARLALAKADLSAVRDLIGGIGLL